MRQVTGAKPLQVQKDTTPYWTMSPWPRNLYQMASDNPGAVQLPPLGTHKFTISALIGLLPVWWTPR
jgi:hypothetical protein